MNAATTFTGETSPERLSGRLSQLRAAVLAATALTSLAACDTDQDTPVAAVQIEAESTVAEATTTTDPVIPAIPTTEAETSLPPTTATANAPAVSTAPSTTTPPTTEPSLTLPPVDGSGTFSLDTFAPAMEFGVGERIGRIFTDDGHIDDVELIMTDSRNYPDQWVREPIESPEEDYVIDGAGLSRDNGYPGKPGVHSVMLAHNTKPGIDYFRNLRFVKAGAILTVEYDYGDYKDILQFEAVSDPLIMPDTVETAQFIYGPKSENYGLNSSLTLYTCNTDGGDSDDRVVMILRPISLEAHQFTLAA